MKPRVAYLLQMFGIGGMPQWLYHLAATLQDEFEFHFVATHSRQVVPEYREVARVAYVSPRRRVLAAYLWWQRIDIAQVANLRLYTDAALLARVPVVIERTDGLRGGAALNPKQGLDAVVASTRGTIPEIGKLIDPARIHLIYNGVDVARFERAAPERFGFAQDDVIIGRTSRLAGGKNISLLIRSVLALRADAAYRHVRLVICGDDTRQDLAPPMMAQLRREAAPLGESVVFTGEVTEPAGIVRGFDIATCTSRPGNEGIPNSLIEAMAAARPVVSTAVDDIPELVMHGESGLLVPSDDVEALTAALRTLVDDAPLRRRMGDAGQARVRKDFSLGTQAGEYGALYRHFLELKGRRSGGRLAWR